MISTPVFHLPDDLPPETALALFDLLRGLIDALWQQYETELLELIMDEPEADLDAQQAFDFNDDLPF